MHITFWVDGKPATAGSKKFVGITKSGRPIITDDCKRSSSWKTKIKNTAKIEMKDQEHKNLFGGALNVYFAFYMARPKGHYNKYGIKEKAPAFPTVRPDVLKMSRAVEDALNNVIWHDDSQIISEHICKRYCDAIHPYEGAQIEIFEL